MTTPRSRPGESAGVTGAVALLVARLLGVTDADTIVALGVLFAALPALVTFAVVTWRKR